MLLRRRKAIVNNLTITTPPGVTPEGIAGQISGSLQEMLDPYKAKPLPVKPDPLVVPHARRNPLRRRHHWVTVRKDEPLPRGRIVWAEPHGGGGLAGGLKVCVVRRG